MASKLGRPDRRDRDGGYESARNPQIGVPDKKCSMTL